MALEQYEGMLHSCGHPLHISTDPDFDGEWIAEETRCHACTAAYEYAQKFANNKAPQALLVSTRMRRQPTPT